MPALPPERGFPIRTRFFCIFLQAIGGLRRFCSDKDRWNEYKLVIIFSRKFSPVSRREKKKQLGGIGRQKEEKTSLEKARRSKETKVAYVTRISQAPVY